MAKAIIKSVYEIRPVNTKNGEKFKLDLELEDGTKGWSSLVKSRDTYKAGDEIEYEISNDQYKNINIKSDKKPWTPGGVSTDYSKEKIIKSLELAVAVVHRKGLKGIEDEALLIADKYLTRFTSKGL